MSNTHHRNVEQLLRSAAFSSPVHKEALRGRLFGDMQALELDDLALVAGGVTMNRFRPEDWPEASKEKTERSV